MLSSSSFSRMRPLRRAGFGLLEVILVFAVILGAGVATFAVFSSANTKASAKREADLLTLERANLTGLMQGQRDYSALTTTWAIQGKVVPDAYVNADGVSVHNTYGNPVTFTPYGGGTSIWSQCMVANSCYRIRTLVAQSDCLDVVVALQHVFAMIVVNGHQMTRPTGIIKPEKVAGFCLDTDPATINLWGP